MISKIMPNQTHNMTWVTASTILYTKFTSQYILGSCLHICLFLSVVGHWLSIFFFELSVSHQGNICTDFANTSSNLDVGPLKAILKFIRT